MHGVHVLDYVLGASQASRKVFFPPENLQTKHKRKGSLELAVAGLQEKLFVYLILSLIKEKGAVQKHKACQPAGRKRRRGL